MAFERGGRTDKFGNRYEDRYVVNRMIALLREQISSITIEPVGEDESGVDLLIDKGNGIQEFHQCKARNDDSDRWTLASLAKHKMFAHIREHVKSKNEFYIWVSPLTFIGLSDLCTAARNSPSADIFYNFQLSLERKKLFDQIRNRLGLSESEDGVEQTLFYLHQIEFAQIPDNTLSAEMDCQNLESLFIGDGETIYDVLINFPKRDYYGKPITALTLVQYLKQRGFQRRTYADNIKISAKIQDLNNEFADWFHPIKEFLFETVAAQRIIQNIENETNVLLLGAAGSGKSGCVGVLQKYLENNHIPYLAIKLDKHPPAYSIDQYSKDLELPISPVLALERMVAKESVGVLILDQLDSLRWTSAHSETALPICKKMLMQARGVSDKKIIVVLVSRAFDFENDTELKALCSDLQEWSIIHVEPWDENTVKQLVGADIFVQLPPQTRKLLQSPNNLAIWMNLDSDLRYSAFKGSTELIESWLQQTRKHITQHDISRVALDDCLKKLLRCSRKSSAVPRSILNAEEAVIDFCLSEGLLYQNKSTVSFSHQSIADYLNVEQNLNAIYEQDIPVSATLPEFDKQLPNIRIQTQMLWLKLLDGEESFFLAKGREFLESEGIRFYYKCTFWEALGQSDSPGENAFGLIRQYWGDTAWHDFLYRVVFCGHFPFACHYVSYGFAETWMEPQALQLLSTIFTQEPEFVLDCLEPYAFQNEQTDRDIYQCFSFSPTEKSDRVFSFRMRILKKYPEWGMESYQFGDLVQLFPLRAIEYLKFFLSECISFFDHSTHDISDDFLKLSQTHPQEVIEELADAVSDIAPSEPSTAIGLYQWTENRERLSAQRFFAKLIEKALFVMLQKDFKWTKNFIVQHLHPKSLLEQEWLLKLIAALPDGESDLAYTWLMEDFPLHFFEYTSSRERKTSYACDILTKFSNIWTEEQFRAIENHIFSYHEPNELHLAKQRFECKQRFGYRDFSPYWGNLQSELLPCLDHNRVQPRTKVLISVLQRRAESIHRRSRYIKDRSFGVFAVHSPISDHTEKLSDAAWIKLLCTCDQKKKQARQHWYTDGKDSSPEQFALSFQNAMSAEPQRFLKIIKQLPNTIENCYIAAILRTIEEATVFNSLPFDELVSAIQYFLGDFDTESDMSVSTAFCEILRNHALTPWPANFYERLCFLARFHSNPSPEQYALTSHDDPNHSSSESLAGNSLNCVRGYAFYAISNVLKEHPDLETVFFDVLQQGLLDPHPAVRYSLMDCLCQVYSINQELACNWFCALLEQDIRVLSHPLAPYLVLYDFDRHHDLYQKAIGEAFEGSDSDLAKKGAIIAAALYKEKNKMNELLFRNPYTADQLEGLGIQLGYYAWSADNTHAKEALMHILEYCEKVPSSILRECFDPEHVLRVEPEITRSVIGKKLDSNGKSVILYAFKQLNSSAFYRLRGLIYLCCQKMCTCHDEQKYFVIRDVPELLFRLLDLPELTEQELADYLSLFDLAYQHSAITTNDLLQKTQK